MPTPTTLARGYLNKLLSNDNVASWLAENRPEYLDEFKAITELP